MKRMSKIVRNIANILYTFILVFGAYIILHGHLTPGGGFQGGAVVASAFALILAAYGSTAVKDIFKEKDLSVIESIGAVGFVSLAFLGLGITFFYNFLANSGGLFGNAVSYGANPGNLNTAGVILLMNISVGLKVLAGIGIIVILMALGIRDETKKEVNVK